jgi:hypothetical protein
MSSSLDSSDDLNPVAAAEQRAGPAVARHDLAINGGCDTGSQPGDRGDQLAHRHAGW